MQYNKLNNLTIQHEYYKPERFKHLRKFKKVLLTGFYLSILITIIGFAENKRTAQASHIEKSDLTSINTKTQKALEDYYTDVIGKRYFSQLAVFYTNKYEIPTSLLVSLMETESNYNQYAINHNVNGSTDRGLCQLNSSTFRDLTVEDFFNPEINISKASELLRWCIDQSDNNLVIALAYYNAGYGNVNNQRVGEITLNYIDKILDKMTLHEENELKIKNSIQ